MLKFSFVSVHVDSAQADHNKWNQDSEKTTRILFPRTHKKVEQHR